MDSKRKENDERFFCIEVIRKIIEWWKENGRDYPWRRTADPYKVFVAEFMLQRTTPGHVLNVYEDFLIRYPIPEKVSSSSETEFEMTLYPLGMRHRAMTFKSALEKLMNEYAGAIPEGIDKLLELPGVGLYTARAVMCFAFGKDFALVDVNSMRVLGRALNLKSEKRRPHTDYDFWGKIDCLVPDGRGREFNLALIDFAALVCRRRKPSCKSCPVSIECRNYVGEE